MNMNDQNLINTSTSPNTTNAIQNAYKEWVKSARPTVCYDPLARGIIYTNTDVQKIATSKAEEWIWVEGYKGTEKNLTCRDYQFELGKQYDIPEDQIVVECQCGFHFCKDLKDVFHYYGIEGGNRFFKVSGLVRKRDYENYGNKLVAKSIIFTRELSLDEIIESAKDFYHSTDDWSTDDWKIAMELSIRDVRHKKSIDELVALGYSKEVSEYIIDDHSAVATAKAIANQPGLTMDGKIITIMNVYHRD